MSKYKAEGREDKIQNLLALIDKTYFVIDLILFTIFLTLYFFLGNIYRGLTESEMPTFRVLYIITALYSLISFPATSLDGVLSSYEEFAYMADKYVWGIRATCRLNVAAQAREILNSNA